MDEPKREGLARVVRPLIRMWEGEQSPAPKPALRVTTHVARDLLQNAAYFNSVPKAIAEYVTNAIDNAPPGKPVRCEVTVSREQARIADNASGMTYEELHNFFQMHGENVQRLRGRTVRGQFGTGKSAAFGIADTLHIETVKNGKRSIVELRRADVEAAKDGQPIPIHELIVNASVRAHSGTIIAISELNVKNVDADAVRRYLNKILGRHLRTHQVIVNDTPCKYSEPPSEKSLRFRSPREITNLLGSATCVLKISSEPLLREENVIAVLCNGYLHATTLAGKQSEPFVEYIFGEVEAPMLDRDTGPLPPFDNTRNLSLNPQNPRVQALNAWLADCIDQVLRELIERDRRRKYSQEMRMLRKVADEIQSFLDDDFVRIQETLPWATISGTRRRKASRAKRTQSAAHLPEPGTPSFVARGRAFVRRLLGGEDKPFDGAKALENIRRGGRVQFEINYYRMGKESPRSRYIANRRAIYLNRDHPQLLAAEAEAGVDSVTFKMLSCDIAFTEYALAVVSQLADQGIEVADPIDASEMVQEILDRLGRQAAEKFWSHAQTAALPQPQLESDVEGNKQNQTRGE